MSGEPDLSPLDDFNKSLLSHVHPEDWINPEPAGRYNMVAVGAGTAGLVTAAGAAGLGAKVALLEKNLLGGDCLNVGCVPSKCLIRSSRAAADVRDAGHFGIRVPDGAEVDFAAVMERMRRLRSTISIHDSARRFRDELGVDVFLGEGRFTGRETLEVGGKTLRFSKAAVTTGARAFHPPIEGLRETGFLTNETVFSLTARPRRLAVIGAGPIGCELAQAFRRLGSEVSLLDQAPQILFREDRDAARIVERVFAREGITTLLGCGVRKVEPGGGAKRVHLECGSKSEILEVDEILVGVGRVPNVEGLNLEAAGVEYDPKRGIHVDDRLRTTNPRIYAAGDICLEYKFTHTADAAARIVIQNALFWGRKKHTALNVPWCTFTDPEIAHVGMYEKDAVEKGIPVETFTVPLGEVDRAVADGEEEGLARIHVKRGTDRILGATIVARHAGEMISEISVAMKGNLGLGGISDVIHPYPTQAEVIKKAADAYRRTKLTPGVKKIFSAILSFTRGRQS